MCTLSKFIDLSNIYRILSDNQLNGTLDMGNNVNEGLDLVDIQNNGITSVKVYDSFKGQFLKCVSLPISVFCFVTISAFLSCQTFAFSEASLLSSGFKGTHSATILFCQIQCRAQDYKLKLLDSPVLKSSVPILSSRLLSSELLPLVMLSSTFLNCRKTSRVN